MQKQAPPKDSKELPPMSKEEFLDKFYEGKINYKLPSKYPENFTICKSYNDGKKEIPLTNRDKVSAILKDCYNSVKPIVKKFKLSLALLVESAVTFKGVAWTRKIKIDFSMPALSGKREEIIAYTSMIEVKIRNPDHPQNPKMFLNKTTILAIMLHELAHTRHMNHGIGFATFLKEIYEYAVTLGLFAENEEHMKPSSRPWEVRMFETKGSMTMEELESFFTGSNENNQGMEEDHGDHWENENREEQKEQNGNPINKTTEKQTVKGSSDKKEKLPAKKIIAEKNEKENNKIEKTKINPLRKIDKDNVKVEKKEKIEKPSISKSATVHFEVLSKKKVVTGIKDNKNSAMSSVVPQKKSVKSKESKSLKVEENNVHVQTIEVEEAKSQQQLENKNEIAVEELNEALDMKIEENSVNVQAIEVEEASQQQLESKNEIVVEQLNEALDTIRMSQNNMVEATV